jgi:transposase
MARRKKDPLRPLARDERQTLERVVRSGSARADHISRAKALLAVADGQSYTEAARLAGRRSGDGVAQLVGRFNQHGLAALDNAARGARPKQYGAAEQERILREFRRSPDRERDGTATWSLTTLKRALRRASDGFPHISTFTILRTLWEAGYTFQQNRTWCATGTAQRKRKDGTVRTVTDPDATPKKN